MPFSEFGIDAGCADLAQIPVRIAVSVQPSVGSDQLWHLVRQRQRTVRIVNYPLPNLRMLLCENQELVETPNQSRHAQQRPGLVHRHHRADGQPVTANLSASDRLPLQGVSAVVATAGIQSGHPLAGGGEIVADLRRFGATKRDFDRIKPITVGVGT